MSRPLLISFKLAPPPSEGEDTGGGVFHQQRHPPSQPSPSGGGRGQLTRYILLTAFLFITTSLRAQETPVLTWQDCLALAAQNNPDFLAAQKSLQASRANARGSYNALLPGVSLSNSYSETGRAGSGASSAGWSAGLNASVDIFNLSHIASVRAALARRDSAKASLTSASADVLLDLYQTFTGLMYAQEQITVAAHILEIWEKDAELIGLRYNSGRESKGNKMRTDAQLLQARAESSQAQRDLRAAQQSLSAALGQDAFRVLAVTGSWTRGSLSDDLPPFDALVDATPRVRVQKASVQESRAAALNSRSSLFPNLSMSYSRGVSGPNEFPADNDTWTLGAQLSYPIFAGGPTAAYYNVSAANRNLERAELNLKAARLAARTALENAWSSLAQAHDTVQVQKAFLDAARQRRQESDIRYENGLMTFEEWQIVVADLVNFEKSYLRSEQNLVLAEAQWRFAQGEGLGDNR
jgi:outer membrane protein